MATTRTSTGMAGFVAFMRAANSRREAASAAARGQAKCDDPMIRILATLAERDKPVSEVVAGSMLPLSQVFDGLSKLEALRLVRRIDRADRAIFALQPDGRDLLAMRPR